MELVSELYDFIFHMDENLIEMIKEYGMWSYLFLFLIVFCETGFVIAPFLPGDSLVFITGALSSGGELSLPTITAILAVAAILGDTVNYHIGKFIGPKIFHKENVRFFKKKHLCEAHEFYEKHGGKAVILARFIPVIRSFVPFVAGIGCMTYSRFIAYNIAGALLWVALFSAAGWFFGNLPVVRENFSLVIYAIIFISYIPAFMAMVRRKTKKHESERKSY